MRYNATDFLIRLFKEPVAPVAPDLGINPADLSPDWFEAWEERAAIREYDGGLPKEQAEVAALTDILTLLRERGLSLPPRRGPKE